MGLKLLHKKVRGWSNFWGFGLNNLKLEHTNKFTNAAMLMWMAHARDLVRQENFKTKNGNTLYQQ